MRLCIRAIQLHSRWECLALPGVSVRPLPRDRHARSPREIRCSERPRSPCPAGLPGAYGVHDP